MINNQQLLLALFSVIGLILLSFATMYLISTIIYGTEKPKHYASAFWALFLGSFFWVSIYAITKTKGLTILAPLPILIIMLFRNIIKNADVVSKQQKNKEFLFLGLFILFQFLFFAFSLTSFNGENVKYIAGDFNIYFRMADRLNAFGVESYNFNLTHNSDLLPSPYHYGDIWFYAAIARFISANPSVTFLVAFTFLSSTFSLGLYVLIRNIFRNCTVEKSPFLYLIIIAGLFAGLPMCFPSFLSKYAEPYTLSIFNWGKVMVLSCALVGILILVSQKQWVASALTVAISGLMYINSAPAIYGSFFLLLLLLLVRKEINAQRWFASNLLFVGITLMIVVFLYKVIPLISHNQPQQELQEIKIGFLEAEGLAKYLKTTINIFIGGGFQLFTILPYLILLLIGLLILKKPIALMLKSLDYSVVFLIYMFICGLGSWALLHPLSVDTVQFFHNVLAPIYAIGITLIIFFIAIVVQKKWLNISIVLVALFSVYLSIQHIFYAWSFDRREWNSLVRFFKNEQQSAPFINLKSMKQFDYWSAKKTDQYIPLNILSYRWHDYHNISLNAPFIRLTENSIYAKEELKDIVNATFTTFYNKSKSEGMIDYPTIVQKFVSKYHVKYIAVSKDTVLPDYLRSKINDSLLLVHSDFTIYKFK